MANPSPPPLVVPPRSVVAEVLAAVSMDEAVSIDAVMADALKAVGVEG